MASSIRIHHVAIAVDSLESAIPIFEELLGTASALQEDVTDQKVRVAVIGLEGGRIELLEATAPDSPVAKFIARHGPGIHHVALSVPNIETALAELESRGYRLIDQVPRAGAQNDRIAFLNPKSTSNVLIELVEESSSPEP